MRSTSAQLYCDRRHFIHRFCREMMIQIQVFLLTRSAEVMFFVPICPGMMFSACADTELGVEVNQNLSTLQL